MGAFYGSVYFRTEDREAVRRILDEVARKRRCRFLLGPALRGWVAAYPEMHGQDERVAKAAAKPFAGEALYVVVHDSDIFAYTYFRDGKVVDEYNSRPDFFEKIPPHVKERCRGRPDRLAHLLAPGKTVAELQQLLSPEEAEGIVFADDLLQQFADLLGLPNALTSYDYLQADETEGTEGWDQFLHVPDLSAERARKREAAANVERAKGWMQGEKLLLVEMFVGGPDFFPVPPAWCPDREGSGFLVCWRPRALDLPPTPLQRYAPPWTEPAETGLVMEGSWDLLVPSPSGHYLIAGSPTHEPMLPLWDVEAGAVVAKIAQPGAVVWAGFSPDDKFLITLCRSVNAQNNRPVESLHVAEVLSGQSVATFRVEQTQRTAVHPSGVILIADTLNRLTLMDLLSGQVRKRFCVGGRLSLGPQHQAAVAAMQQLMVQLDPNVVEQQMRAAMPQQIKRLEKMARRGNLPPGVNAEQFIKEFKQGMEKTIAQMRQHYEQRKQAGAAGFAVPDRGNETVSCLECSADGRFVFCGTNHGVRVYDWDALNAAMESTPAPVFAAEAEAVSIEEGYGMTSAHRMVYDLAHDAAGNRLLFGGLEGKVRSIDLATGRCGTLLDLPGRPAIQRLGLSRDRSALCCTCQPDLLSRKRRRPALLQVWNYAALEHRLTVEESLRQL